MNFSECIHPCNLYPYWDVEHFYHPENPSQLVTPPFRGSFCSDFHLQWLVLALLQLCMNGILQGEIHVQLLWLSMVSVKFSHGFACINSSFLFLRRIPLTQLIHSLSFSLWVCVPPICTMRESTRWQLAEAPFGFEVANLVLSSALRFSNLEGWRQVGMDGSQATHASPRTTADNQVEASEPKTETAAPAGSSLWRAWWNHRWLEVVEEQLVSLWASCSCLWYVKRIFVFMC